MKREAYNHPKMLDLAARLGVTTTHARGIVATLWNWAADAAYLGDVGKWNDGVIARACDWAGDPTEFVDNLVGSGWLDRCAVNRLVVHDLEEHAPDWWKSKVKRFKKSFVIPTPIVGLPQVSEASVSANVSANETANSHAPPILCSSLETSANQTSENPTSAPAEASGFDVSVVDPETLGDAARLRLWFDHDAGRKDSIVQNSEAFWHNTVAAAAKALTAPGIRDRVGLFKWLVKWRQWAYLRCSDDDLAATLRREARGTGADRFLEQLAEKVGKVVA